MTDFRNVKTGLISKARERMDLSRDYSDDDVKDLIDELLLQEDLMFIPPEEKRRLSKELFDALRRLDILQIFVDDPDISEIMINGMDSTYVEKKGKLYELPIKFDSLERFNDVIQQIAAGCNRTVNASEPMVDARLPDGSRVNIVLPPVSLSGPVMTIRRFPKDPITAEGLVELGTITEECRAFLEKLVKAGYNVFISGGTGSGKTTFLNALSGFIPKDERIVTIEDDAELKLQGLKNLIRLETRNTNTADCKEISVRDLIKCSLRMRPDRIILGEVRGPEAIDLMQCLNTGHSGSMSTGHANSAGDMLYRLESMILMGMDIPLTAIRHQIASGIDIIVHLSRMRDKSRKVVEITEILGVEKGIIRLNTLFEFRERGETDGRIDGELVQRGELFSKEKLYRSGLLQL